MVRDEAHVLATERFFLYLEAIDNAGVTPSSADPRFARWVVGRSFSRWTSLEIRV